jgi:hypothetical protein
MASVHATSTPPETGELEQRVASLEARVAALEDAVSRGGEALSALRHGVRGAHHDGHHAGHHAGQPDGQRRSGERPGDVVNAGFAAAARAARDLVSEVQQQWSPRRRT